MLDDMQLKKIYNDSTVWDCNLSWARGGYADAEQLLYFREQGIKVVSLSVAFRDIEGIAKVIRAIASVFADCKKYPDKIAVIKTVNDIKAANKQDKIAVFMSFQETLPFEENLDLIQLYYNLGVKIALLAYNNRNSVADGCAETTNAGLSAFGKMVVREMNNVGMLIDGSHSGFKSTMDAMEISTAPFIFSHGNCYGLYPHYRNIHDEQIKACAQTGGVIGITGIGDYVGEIHPTSLSIFRHIDYIAELVGIDHVGLGLDWVKDPKYFLETGVLPCKHRWPLPPTGRYEVNDYLGPEYVYGVVQIMNEHGYSEQDIRKVLGNNFMRVAEQVWK